MFLATFLLVAGGALVQWGVVVTQVQDMVRRQDRMEMKLDDKMMPRDEFEKRHQELEKRVEELRERVQEMEIDRMYPKHK